MLDGGSLTKPSRDEVMDVWREKVRPEMEQTEPPLDVQQLLDSAAVLRRNEADEHLGFWIASADAAIGSQLLLQSFVDKLFPDSERSLPSFLFFLSKLTFLSIGIRRLVVAGLDDPAMVLGRALLEVGDIAIASLGDDEFGRTVALEWEEEEKLWREQIGYGRIRQRLVELGEIWGVEDEISAHLQWKADAKKALSASVHGTGMSSVRSLLVPSLIHEGQFVRNALGALSTQGPELLGLVLVESKHLNGLVWAALQAGVFSESRHKVEAEAAFMRFAAHAFWIQELADRYPERLLHGAAK